MCIRDRCTVECPRDERLGAERLVARQAATEVIVDLVLLCPPLDLFLAVIGAEEDDVVCTRFHACRVEHRLQRNAGPPAVAAQPVQRSAVARALESHYQILSLIHISEPTRLLSISYAV